MQNLVRVSASMGVTVSDDDSSANLLLEQAVQAAMYGASATARTIGCFTESKAKPWLRGRSTQQRYARSLYR